MNEFDAEAPTAPMNAPKRRGRKCTFPEPWLTLANEAGGAGKLAKAMGISYGTLTKRVKAGPPNGT